MSDRFRKRWKTAATVMLAVLPSVGWAGREIYCRYKECSDLKANIIPRVDATATQLKDVKDEQKRGMGALERIPVLDDRTARMEDQGRDLAKEVQQLRAGQSRIEGILEVLKRDKTVAVKP